MNISWRIGLNLIPTRKCSGHQPAPDQGRQIANIRSITPGHAHIPSYKQSSTVRREKHDAYNLERENQSMKDRARIVPRELKPVDFRCMQQLFRLFFFGV
jgi:hypothetical protein